MFNYRTKDICEYCGEYKTMEHDYTCVDCWEKQGEEEKEKEDKNGTSIN